ncbi:hypothetical protein L210DRAFT_976180 [Boletus edulis BED1]|uniref:Uncharacterized protein n=1 Tax=Boletus edulis BED1 TaxID=1328754 RepID=A0AAD4C2Y9_BOLED|nr:hypothetical protein L210DRAFT_976180 [Boletus edulis BED1]
MLKRQRPATPPPSSLGDPPSFLPSEPIRPILQPLHARDPSEPRSKRRRTQPPPLDGALRGWLESEPAGSHWESDGEEDWIEDPHTDLGSPLHPSTTASPYKDANTLLHELHLLNQHRMLFTRPPRDQPLNPSPRAPLPAAHTHMQNAPVGYGPTAWTNGSPYHPTLPQFASDGVAGRSCCLEPVEDKGLVEEVQCVRQRYEGTNKLLGSLFLSRRREVEELTYSAPDPSADLFGH